VKYLIALVNYFYYHEKITLNNDWMRRENLRYVVNC